MYCRAHPGGGMSPTASRSAATGSSEDAWNMHPKNLEVAAELWDNETRSPYANGQLK